MRTPPGSSVRMYAESPFSAGNVPALASLMVPPGTFTGGFCPARLNENEWLMNTS